MGSDAGLPTLDLDHHPGILVPPAPGVALFPRAPDPSPGPGAAGGRAGLRHKPVPGSWLEKSFELSHARQPTGEGPISGGGPRAKPGELSASVKGLDSGGLGGCLSVTGQVRPLSTSGKLRHAWAL